MNILERFRAHQGDDQLELPLDDEQDRSNKHAWVIPAIVVLAVVVGLFLI